MASIYLQQNLKMESNINMWNSLPSYVAIQIASSLPDQDVCALGSCSTYWRQICGLDSIWVSLTNKRWPSLFTHPDQLLDQSDPIIKDWKGFYGKRHKEIANTSTSVASYINYCTSESNSIDLQGYRKAYDQLVLDRFSLNDVELFLFGLEFNVVLNLLGLHYSIKCLKLPPEVVAEALRRRMIHEREVKIEVTKLVREGFGCVLVSESHVGLYSLHNLAMADRDMEEEDEALRMLEEDWRYDFLVNGKIFASC